MNILFYYPSNKRTIPIDVALFELQRRSHKLFLLTTVPEGPLHSSYRNNGASVHVSPVNAGIKLVRFVCQVLFLIRFCKMNKIDVVHSHLQQTNVIAVFAGLLMNSRVVVFRHHCKFHFLVKNSTLRASFNERLADWLINTFAKKIIVPSRAVKMAMLTHEKVSEMKIEVIPYIYDFVAMKEINQKETERIRHQFSAQLRIIMVSRLTPYKRHATALKPIISLIKEGYDICVMIMDDGPEEKSIRELIEREGVINRVHLLGFQSNILEYISAADVIIHPSLTEASNSAVKEAALLKKIVMVCDQVGDFNEYIVHKENGLLLSVENFSSEAYDFVKDIYANPQQYVKLGSVLHDRVVTKFKKSKAVIDQYESL